MRRYASSTAPQVLADNTESDEAMCLSFERWIGDHYPARQQGTARP